MTEAERTRLHISPFNATLYDNIVPKSLQPVATGVSFHSVQTFPERGFGYVELPKADADKLRKKLHGATLRGVKMNIQEAKPEKRRRDKDDSKDEPQDEPRKKAKKTKSTKKDKEISGFELPDSRQVKRGWTEEPGKYEKRKKDKGDKTDKKDNVPKREKSKYSSKQEVLFKQKLPEHVKLAQKAEGKEKKDKKSKKPKNTVVIHEFEKNKPVPSFLKSTVTNKTSTSTEFVAGKGWVDSEGNVIEAITVKPKREDRIAQIPDTPMEIKIKMPEPQQPALQNIITAGAKALKDDLSSDDSSDESEDEEDEDTSDDSESEDEQEKEAQEEAKKVPVQAPPVKQESEPAPKPESDSESASRASSESDSESDSEAEPGASQKASEEAEVANQPEAADAMDVDSVPDPRPSTPPREVHPLEALYKRPKPSATETPRPAPINTAFSFFGAGDDDDVDETADAFPQTPFTQNRVIRSAAPTPDTAAIGRKFSFSFGAAADDIEEDEEDEEAYEDANQVPLGVKATEEGGEKEETEFAKWFWENRGDTNRAWKKRRRDVLKQKRQRENRRISRRVI